MQIKAIAIKIPNILKGIAASKLQQKPKRTHKTSIIKQIIRNIRKNTMNF
jgi:hypothetical protein